MNRIIRFISLLFVLVAFVGCNKDVETLGSDETVTLTLNVNTSDSGSRAEARYIDASPYEGIRTLRVLVTDRAMTEIYYNEKTTVVENPDNITSSTQECKITIPDVPVGEVSFYVIANEESIGEKYTVEEILSNVENKKLKYIDEANPKYFPKKGPEIKKLGLPMSGKTMENITKETKSVSVELERAVTKIALTIENATSSTITLQDVIFGPFFGDRFYVFPEVELDVPEDAQYSSLSYENVGFKVDPNSTSPSLSLYLYPTYAWKSEMPTSPYTLSLVTDNYTYQSQVFAPGVNSFRRNKQVNIRARITTTVGMKIDYAVQAWDDYTVNVPDFE